MTTSTNRPDGGELKPCPFCGEVPSLLEDGWTWLVQCKNDGCSATPMVLNTERHVAIANWNTRTPTNESPAPQAAATPPTIGGKTAFERIHDRIADYLKSSDPATGITGFIFERFINVPPPIATQPAPQPPVEGLREALEFYADPFAWKAKHDPEDIIRIPDFYSETSFGDKAAAALASPSLTAVVSKSKISNFDTAKATVRREMRDIHAFVGFPDGSSEAQPSAPDVRETSERVLQSLNALASGLLSPDQNETSTAMAAEAARAIEDATIIHDFLSAPPVADREAIARAFYEMQPANDRSDENGDPIPWNGLADFCREIHYEEATKFLALISAQPAKGER